MHENTPQEMLKPLALRLLKCAARRFAYTVKSQQDPAFDPLLALEELFYPSFYAEWARALVRTGNLTDPSFRDASTRLLLTLLPEALEGAETLMERVGLDGKAEVQQYAQVFDPKEFLP